MVDRVSSIDDAVVWETYQWLSRDNGSLEALHRVNTNPRKGTRFCPAEGLFPVSSRVFPGNSMVLSLSSDLASCLLPLVQPSVASTWKQRLYSFPQLSSSSL